MRELWTITEMGSLKSGDHYTGVVLFEDKEDAEVFYEKLIEKYTNKGYWIQKEEDDYNMVLLMNDDQEWIEIELTKRQVFEKQHKILSKSEINVFRDISSAKEWIEEMEQKGYELTEISTNVNALTVAMKKDNLKLIEDRLKILKIEQKYGAFMSEKDRQLLDALKQQLEKRIEEA